MTSQIPFNKPHIIGDELKNIEQSIALGKISGNGKFTKDCQSFFKDNFGFPFSLLTTSCTDALEMSALLMNINPGDEIIIPSYTFVSTALAFVREGAKIVFADSRRDHPGIDEAKIEDLITERTKAIVVVHYAGIAVNMDLVMSIATKYNLYVVEDAAQAIDSYYDGRPLGSFGHLSTFSFHETKNIICGEGGLLVVNDESLRSRAEVIWEKGTNRAEFFRGEINKYGWKDTGSSFLPSEIIAAFLLAQLDNLDRIQSKRKNIWNIYYESLLDWSQEKSIKLPALPSYASSNGHMFYLICNSLEQRDSLIAHLKNNGIHATFHYQSLHKSEFYKSKTRNVSLPFSDLYSDCLLRLPIYYDLNEKEQLRVIEAVLSFND